MNESKHGITLQPGQLALSDLRAVWAAHVPLTLAATAWPAPPSVWVSARLRPGHSPASWKHAEPSSRAGDGIMSSS